MIIFRAILICLISAFSGIHFLSAQTEKELMNNHQKALGEMLNESSMYTFGAKGTISASGLSFNSLLYFRLPRSMYMEMKLGTMLFKMIYTDSVKWEYNSMTKKEKITRRGASGWSDEAAFFIMNEFVNYKQFNHKVHLKGRTKLDSLDVFEMQLLRKGKDPLTIYLNAKTYLINKVVEKDGFQYFADYQNDGRFLFPRFIIISKKQQDVIFRNDTIEFNIAIPDSLFKIPEQMPVTNEGKEKSKGIATGTRSRLDRADRLYEQGAYDSAINLYTQSLKHDGETYRAFNSRGLTKLKTGDYYDALVDFNRASEIWPEAWAARNNIGLTKYYLGDYQNAIKDFTRALEMDNQADNAMFNRGMANFNLGEFEKASADFSQLVKRKPKNGEWNFRYGTAQAQLKQYEDALLSYRKAISFQFVNAEVFNYKGVSHYNLEQYDSAVVNFKEAVDRDPLSLQYLENLGRALYDAGDFDKAKKYFEDYIARKEDDASIHNLLGLCKYNDENYKGAIKDFTRAIELAGKEAVYYDNRASAKAEIEDYDGAIADLGQSINLYPNDPSIFYRRGMLKIHTSKKLEGCMDLGTAHEMKYEPAKEAIMKNCN